MLIKNYQQIVQSHFRVRLIHQRKISLSLSLSHAIGRNKFSRLLICDKVIPLPLEVSPLNPVSYTHLTLPTNREV